MMKFFRKYNKHLLAVFMAGLLVIWLGGTALEELVKPDHSKEIVGTSKKYGVISAADRMRARKQEELRLALPNGRKLSWGQWNIAGAKPGEQIDVIEWILLEREAEHYGIRVSPAEAKAKLENSSQLRIPEDKVRFAAARRDVPTEAVYEAVAKFFSVTRMLSLFQNGVVIPEPELRLTARNVFERANIEMVTLPASSFADPDQKFTEAELQAQFDKYKEDKAIPGTLTFGYYIEPAVDIQYIKVDPDKIKDQLRIEDDSLKRRAFDFWSANRNKDGRFRRSADEMVALRKAAEDVSSNGEKSPPPAVSQWYESFEEAQAKAIDAIKTQEARSEAEAVINKLSNMLKEPWYEIAAEETQFKPAPESVKKIEYYNETVAQLPKGMQYAPGIEVNTIKDVNLADLAELGGIATASWKSSSGIQLSFADMAFNVEGLVTIPEESKDKSIYLSLWETKAQRIEGADGTLYLFRITKATEGRAPTSVDEVADRVAADLRISKGMEKAKEAAKAFAANIGTNGLKAAWEANKTLSEKVTADRGGYTSPPAFARDASRFFGRKNFVPVIGQVTDEFFAKSFELAKKGDDSPVEIVELPDQAAVAVIKGKSLQPFYDKDYEGRRPYLQAQLFQQKAAEMVAGHLNAKKIRERAEFEMGKQ